MSRNVLRCSFYLGPGISTSGAAPSRLSRPHAVLQCELAEKLLPDFCHFDRPGLSLGLIGDFIHLGHLRSNYGEEALLEHLRYLLEKGSTMKQPLHWAIVDSFLAATHPWNTSQPSRIPSRANERNSWLKDQKGGQFQGKAFSNGSSRRRSSSLKVQCWRLVV